MGYITPEAFFAAVRRCEKSSDGEYLLTLPQMAQELFLSNIATLTQVA